MNATLLHKEVNQRFLLDSNMPKVMKETPAIHVEGILDLFKERLLAQRRDIVVSARIVRLGIRQANRHLIRLFERRLVTHRRFALSKFDNL